LAARTAKTRKPCDSSDARTVAIFRRQPVI
jgi:hypothetical protein